jgi:co-chaperonin GroES (HSP10)
METTLRPLGDDLVIRTPFTPEETNNGELEVPIQHQNRIFTAQVLAVGPGGSHTPSGDPIRPDVEEGSFIVFKANAYGHILRDGSEHVMVIGYHEIICGTTDPNTNNAGTTPPSN